MRPSFKVWQLFFGSPFWPRTTNTMNSHPAVPCSLRSLPVFSRDGSINRYHRQRCRRTFRGLLRPHERLRDQDLRIPLIGSAPKSPFNRVRRERKILNEGDRALGVELEDFNPGPGSCRSHTALRAHFPVTPRSCDSIRGSRSSLPARRSATWGSVISPTTRPWPRQGHHQGNVQARWEALRDNGSAGTADRQRSIYLPGAIKALNFCSSPSSIL
jgi:hypothetical protein